MSELTAERGKKLEPTRIFFEIPNIGTFFPSTEMKNICSSIIAAYLLSEMGSL